MKVMKDISYSGIDNETRKLDVYLPEVNGNGTALLFIHGGGWMKGTKEQFGKVAEWFCRQGYVCVSMQYHLSGQRVYPGALEDARLAFQYMQDNAEMYGYRSDHIAVCGSSAGGYLAAMLGLLQPEDSLGRTEELRKDGARPYAVLLYCPVTTLRTGQEFVHRFMGGSQEELPSLYEGASPVERISAGAPPFCIVQGDRDDLTPLPTTELFVSRLIEAGAQAELNVLEGVPHGFGYGVTSEAQQEACRLLLKFLRTLED